MTITDAVVTAGGIPQPEDPLYPLTQGQNKALLPIGGVPMVQWVLDALSGSQAIRRVVIVGLAQAPALASRALASHKPLHCLPNHGSMLGNVEAGVKWLLAQDPPPTHTLLVSSDIPAITAEMVDWNVRASLATDHEAYYSLISQADMERRFPGSRRSFFKLREGRFCGGDMNLMRAALVGSYHPGWHAVVAARKSALKLARLAGLGNLLRTVAGQMSIAGTEQAVLSRLGVRGRVLRCPYAEAGMDVDKPHQYEMLRRELEARGRLA